MPQSHDPRNLNEWHTASSNLTHHIPHHISKYNGRPPRPLHYFECPKDVLRALRDAITSHGQNYLRNGTIHNDITVENICIGAHFSAPHVKGYLVAQSPNAAHDYTFKSVRALSAPFNCKQGFSLDYLDDLESFYYVLLWMCYAYDGYVGGRPHFIDAQNRAPFLARLFDNPVSRESISEKEALLLGSGIVFDRYPVSEFWGGQKMEELLDNLLYIIGSRYKAKTELGCVRSDFELQQHATLDYKKFEKAINETLRLWERHR